MQIWRYPENFNQTTDVFRFHLSKLGSAFAQLLSRSSIMTVGTSSNNFTDALSGDNNFTDAGQLVRCHDNEKQKKIYKFLKYKANFIISNENMG
jgi:hypothetical protein